MTACLCGFNRDVSECCGPIHRGEKKATTALELMRSRYCAFASGRVDYILATVDPSKREGYSSKDIREWSEGSEWLGLEIVDTQAGGVHDDEGVVEFIARYRSKDEEVAHHERAQFRRIDGEWFFMDGKIMGQEPVVREEPKIGRNDPCPCGSGKKYKKCCA